MYLGIDCGSVSMKAVVIDEEKNMVAKAYLKNSGLIETVSKLLSNINISEKIDSVGITGSGRDLISILIGADLVESEIICHYLAAIEINENIRTIFDIGGEDCKLMTIKDGVLCSFSMNRDCGGGTGAMIESIAARLGVPVHKIGETALRSKTPLSIPSKCGIFAQSAVVSKLNKGVPKEDILMSVCRGLVGNYFSMLAKGQRLEPPYIFQGATAKNIALVKCFEEELLSEIIIPKNPELMGAIGAAIAAKEKKPEKSKFKGWDLDAGDYNASTYCANGCSNSCEITKIEFNGKLVGSIGNRCERCLHQ